MNKIYCVISHTHWDREWYMPYSQFRMRLVDLINRLLDIIKEYPEYIFHLDAQTVVLEDYLEICPQNRDLLKKYISSGNIVVGPWYLQNDFYLTSGEATIRNLIEGRRIAEEFGKCDNVGYAPDQFGNISQLPQILADFGIHSFIFGRGFDLYHKAENGEIVSDQPLPSEFIWRGADGTEALAIHMRYWYNNAQRFSGNIDRSELMLKKIEKSFDGIAMTPYLLLMNGVDHLEAQEDLLPILDKLNERKIDGEIRQMHLSEYIDKVRGYVQDNNIELFKHSGELRFGDDGQILQGTLSSRAYLKRLNVLTQNMFEQRLEPLFAMLEKSGCKGIYPKDYMRYLWKQLMHNHPHDSICGCSRDEIHAHMEDRYQTISEITDKLMEKALSEVAFRNKAAMDYPDEYSLVAVNTVSSAQEGVLEAELLFLEEDNVSSFEIFDSEGQSVEFAVISKEKRIKSVFSPINLPGDKNVDVYKVYMYVPETAGYSFKGYSVRHSDKPYKELELVCNPEKALENEYLRLEVGEDGAVNITEKASGRRLEDCVFFKETGDRGESYDSVPVGEINTTRGINPQITVLQNNEYVGSIRMDWEWAVPADFDFAKEERTAETAVMPVSLILTLKKGSPVVEVGYEIENTAKNHIVKLAVNGDIESNRFFADIPFDIVSHEDGFKHMRSIAFAQPNTSFAALENGDKGLAVFTEGTHECEKTGNSLLEFTVIRSTGSIAGTPLTTSTQWHCPGNQCLRTMSGRFGIMLYESNLYDAEIPNRTLEFRNPLLTAYSPCDGHKLTGGRPAVQDTELSELFFRTDPYSEVVLDGEALISVAGRHILTSAFKLAEDSNGYILRLFNYGEAIESVTVSSTGKIILSNMAEDKAEYLGENTVQLSFSPKKIITLRIE